MIEETKTIATPITIQIQEVASSVESDTIITENHTDKKLADKYLFNGTELYEYDGSFNFLWKDRLPEVGLALFVGKPGIGKSQLARQLSLHVALGKTEFLGIPLNISDHPVLYISTEDGPEATKACFVKQMEGMGIGIPPQNFNYLNASSLEINELKEQIDEAFKENRFKLVVIDAYGDIHEGKDQNSNQEGRKSLKTLVKIADHHKCCILILHHLVKRSYERPPTLADVLGNSSLAAKVRTVIALYPEKEYNYLSILKGNYTSREIQSRSMQLRFEEDTLIHTSTGINIELHNQMNVGIIKREVEHEKIKNGVFNDSIKLTYTEAIEGIESTLQVSKPTAKRRLKELVESKQVVHNDEHYQIQILEKQLTMENIDESVDENCEVV